MSEQQIESEPVPTSFASEEEFIAYVRDVLAVEKDYDTASDALWKIALAGMNYAEDYMGVSSAQRAWAEMAFLAHSRNITGPMLLLDGTQALYPQYSLLHQVESWMHGSKDWIKEAAEHLLATSKKAEVAPYVWDHWKQLVEDGGCSLCAQAEGEEPTITEIHLDAPGEETPDSQ